jgi:polyisoprenoid-binding protein YceI
VGIRPELLTHFVSKQSTTNDQKGKNMSIDTNTTTPCLSELADWTSGNWTIDPSHSVVAFAARHLMGKVRGTFSSMSGQLVTDLDPMLCSATASIDVTSVHTGNEMRDNHLRSADFFDVERFPKMSFATTSVRNTNGVWLLVGDLTIKNVTRPIQFELDVLGIDPTGLQGETRIGLSARGDLFRRDFGVTFGLAGDSKLVVGDKVDLTLDIQAVLDN